MKPSVGVLLETKVEETVQHCHKAYLLPWLIRGQFNGHS